MSKEAVRKITKQLGADAICARLGVTHHSVRHAKATGCFPSGWYDEIDKMCREAGIPCPRAAFNWRSAQAGAA